MIKITETLAEKLVERLEDDVENVYDEDEAQVCQCLLDELKESMGKQMVNFVKLENGEYINIKQIKGMFNGDINVIHFADGSRYTDVTKQDIENILKASENNES